MLRAPEQARMEQMKRALTVGEVARSLHLNPRTIRYYEARGLLPKAHRSAAGYRLYGEEDVARLQLIRRARLMGLSLAETKPLADWAADGQCNALAPHLLALLESRQIGRASCRERV